MSVDFTRFEVATFDCYGTLIDWETGILEAMRPVLERHGIRIRDEDVLAHYARLESSLQRGEWRPYRDVLKGVVQAMGRQFGFTPTPEETGALARSIGRWPAFADTRAALDALARRYRLVILSNIDDDLFAATAPRLGDSIDDVVTAQQVRSYKPAPGHFDEVRARTGLPAACILHIAQSLHHDVAPAKALGFATVWVNRRLGRKGTGATPQATAAPDLSVPDLATLVAIVEEAFTR